VSAPLVEALVNEGDRENAGDGEDIAAMSVFMQAKKFVADGFHVPLSAVEITIRA
jgi:hypothetical protein